MVNEFLILEYLRTDNRADPPENNRVHFVNFRSLLVMFQQEHSIMALMSQSLYVNLPILWNANLKKGKQN